MKVENWTVKTNVAISSIVKKINEFNDSIQFVTAADVGYITFLIDVSGAPFPSLFLKISDTAQIRSLSLFSGQKFLGFTLTSAKVIQENMFGDSALLIYLFIRHQL
jgi:hypothetical protein